MAKHNVAAVITNKIFKSSSINIREKIDFSIIKRQIVCSKVVNKIQITIKLLGVRNG